MKTLEEIGKSAKAAEPVLRIMGTNQKNEALLHVEMCIRDSDSFLSGAGTGGSWHGKATGAWRTD